MEIALKSFFPAIDRSWKSMRSTCDNPACHNTQLMRTIPGGRSGIQAGEFWYCSVDCFALGSRTVLTELSRTRFAEDQRDPRMSLGLILVSRGQLSPDQLRFAQSQAELNHDNLENMLLRLEFVNQKQLAAARAAQWGYPLLTSDRIGHAVKSDIPEILLREFSAAPLEFSIKARRILIGFVFRVEHSLLESIEKITGFRAVPCFISATEYEEQMERVITAPNYESAFIQDFGSPDKMARTLGHFAVEIGVREAIFSPCKNFVWSRLTGKRGKIDVVFQFEAAIRRELQPAPNVHDRSEAVLG